MDGFATLTDQVRQLLVSIIEQSNIFDRDVFLEQARTLRVRGGELTMLELDVPGELRRAAPVRGPLNATGQVTSETGSYVGELLIWAADGVIDMLEFAWVTDDPPTSLPLVTQLAFSPLR